MIATLCGAVLAFRFKVLVLYPVIFAVSIGIVALGLDKGTSAGSMAFQIVCVAVAMQCGYLFGMLSRSVLVASRVHARSLRQRGAGGTQPV